MNIPLFANGISPHSDFLPLRSSYHDWFLQAAPKLWSNAAAVAAASDWGRIATADQTSSLLANSNNGLVTSNMVPAHPHATGAAVYPAFFSTVFV